MFETFIVADRYVAIQAFLSLYASGRTSGIVMESGVGVFHTTLIYVAKFRITQSFSASIRRTVPTEEAHAFTSTVERELVQEGGNESLLHRNCGIEMKSAVKNS